MAIPEVIALSRKGGAGLLANPEDIVVVVHLVRDRSDGPGRW